MMSVTEQVWMATIRNALTSGAAAPRLAAPRAGGTPLTDSQLAHIIEALLADKATEPMLAALYQHIGDDADRLAEIETLLALFQADEAAEAPLQPSSPPRYQLTFLPPPRTTPIPDQVAALWQQGQRWVQDQLGALWIDWRGHAWSQPALQPVLVFRGPQERGDAVETTAAGAIIQQFSIGNEEIDDLDLEIKAVRTAEPDDCTLFVTVRIPSRWPNLSGVEVIVLRSEPERRGQTDEEGQVIFAQFPIKDLTQIGFKINPASI